MSNMIPPAIAELVGRANEIGGEISAHSDAINDLKSKISCEAVSRNTGFVGVMSLAENLEKCQAVLFRWAFSDKRLIEAVDEIGSNVFWASEQIKKLALEFAQHYANLEKRVVVAEAASQSVQARLREHATNNPSVREEVYNSTGGLCFYCETQLIDASAGPVDGLDQDRMFHVDHIVPKTHGGPDHLCNYVPACAKCNSSKTDRPFAQFVKRRNVKLRVINGWPKEESSDASSF